MGRVAHGDEARRGDRVDPADKGSAERESARLESARERVARKVRKLLAQAEDPAATPAESQAFTAKAQRLMTKYAIDAAMAADPDRLDDVVVGQVHVAKPYASQKVALVAAIARANDCRAVYTPLSDGSRRVDVVGFAHDVAWVRTLARSLEAQLAGALAAAASRRPEGLHGRTFSVGFVQGFVDEVAERLAEARRDAVGRAERERGRPQRRGAAEGGSPSVALALLAKADRVEHEYRVRFKDAVTVRRYVRLSSWSGYEPGREAGRRASLLHGALPGRRRLARGGDAQRS
jgi:hypothetical protein